MLYVIFGDNSKLPWVGIKSMVWFIVLRLARANLTTSDSAEEMPCLCCVFRHRFSAPPEDTLCPPKPSFRP